MAIVQVLFTPLERVARLAWFGVIGGLAAILGPILGGLLIEANLFGLGWRLIFLINLPIGLFALWLGIRTIPRTRGAHGLRIDIPGAALFAGGFAGVLLALIDGSEHGWPAWTLVSGLGGLAAIYAGWWRARVRRRDGLAAMIEPTLFELRTFRWGLLAILAFAASATGFLLVLAVSLQQGLGKSPLQTALVHVPFSLGVMAGISLIGKRYLPRFGRWLLVGGTGVLGVGGALSLARVAQGDGGSAILLALLGLAGMGMGMVAGPLPPVVVADVDRIHAGTASATLRTAQQLGGALGIAIVGSAFFLGANGEGAGRLAGLIPASAIFVLLLALSAIASLRLPADIFGTRAPSPR